MTHAMFMALITTSDTVDSTMTSDTMAMSTKMRIASFLWSKFCAMLRTAKKSTDQDQSHLKDRKEDNQLTTMTLTTTTMSGKTMGSLSRKATIMKELIMITMCQDKTRTKLPCRAC